MMRVDLKRNDLDKGKKSIRCVEKRGSRDRKEKKKEKGSTGILEEKREAHIGEPLKNPDPALTGRKEFKLGTYDEIVTTAFHTQFGKVQPGGDYIASLAKRLPVRFSGCSGIPRMLAGGGSGALLVAKSSKEGVVDQVPSNDKDRGPHGGMQRGWAFGDLRKDGAVGEKTNLGGGAWRER